MRASLVCVVSAVVMLATVTSISAQALPSWTPEELVRLKKGELIAGAALLVEDPAEIPLPRVAPEPEVPSIEPVTPEPEYDPKEIPEEYLKDYFVFAPKTYLTDPQRLLSMQETLDREGFLEYHANDSEVNVRMYLFDAQQEIPSPYTLEKLARERYVKNSLTAIVFCFLGDPSRSQLAFGGEGSENLNTVDVRKILESAQMKAMEKSDPADQVESFIVQLSIRLYWLEKSMADARLAATAPTAKATNPSSKKSKSDRSGGAMAKVKPYLLYITVGTFGVLLTVFGAGMAWLLWMRGRKYHFPVLELPRRLGADYAAGVGAVLAFHNKLGSPSSQRDQVPDYLRRM